MLRNGVKQTVLLRFPPTRIHSHSRGEIYRFMQPTQLALGPSPLAWGNQLMQLPLLAHAVAWMRAIELSWLGVIP